MLYFENNNVHKQREREGEEKFEYSFFNINTLQKTLVKETWELEFCIGNYHHFLLFMNKVENVRENKLYLRTITTKNLWRFTGDMILFHVTDTPLNVIE